VTHRWANYNDHHTMQFKPPKDPSFIFQVHADLWMAGIEETHRILWENIIKALKCQTQYTGGKEMTFAFGDKVWISSRKLKRSRGLKKLNYMRTGLYTVSKIINNNTYKLDLLSTMWNYNVFYVLLLNHYTPPGRCHSSTERHPVIVEETDELKVDRILDSSRCYRMLH
jgi:hypothetical protein